MQAIGNDNPTTFFMTKRNKIITLQNKITARAAGMHNIVVSLSAVLSQRSDVYVVLSTDQSCFDRGATHMISGGSSHGTAGSTSDNSVERNDRTTKKRTHFQQPKQGQA